MKSSWKNPSGGIPPWSLILALWVGSALYAWSFMQDDGYFAVELELSPRLPSVSRQRAFDSMGVAADRDTLQRSIQRISRLMEEGRLDRAHLEVELTLPSYPADPSLLSLAAGLYVRLDDLDRAETLYAHLNDIVPDHAQFLSRWGNVLLWKGELDKAKEVLERAHALDPYFTPTIMNLLCVYVASGRESQGDALLKVMTPQDLAFIADWLKNHDEILIRAVGEDAYVRIGQAVLSGGYVVALSFAGNDLPERDAREAREDIATAEAMKRRLHQGSELMRAFGHAIVKEQWGDAVRIGAPRNASRIGLSAPTFRAWHVYARYRAGDESALIELSDLSEQHPDDLYTRLHFVVVLLDNTRHAEGEEELRELDALYPGHALVKLLLACAMAESGRQHEALAKLNALDEDLRPFINRWFAADAAYQQAILNDQTFATWRGDYLTQD